MWNSKKYATMAIVGAGLAVAAATPASAWWGDTYAGVYSYGWPYATYGLTGYGWSGAYGYGGGYGACGDYGAYGAVGYYGGCSPGYGYYGWAPSYGYVGGVGSYGGWGRGLGAGWGGYGAYGSACAGRHHVRGDGYAVASRRLRQPYAVAYGPRSCRHVYTSVRGPRLATTRYPPQNKIAFDANLKLLRAD